MALTSNGRRWMAKNEKGHVAIEGPADDAGLYWCKLTRLPPCSQREMPRENNRRKPRDVDGCLKHQSKRRFKNDGQPETDGANVRVESRRGESENNTLTLTTREESSDLIHVSDSSEEEEERECPFIDLFLSFFQFLSLQLNSGYEATDGRPASCPPEMGPP